MLDFLHQLTAAVYLASGLGAWLGFALGRPRIIRVSVVVLGLGAAVHALWFSLFHTADAAPELTSTPAAASFMAWVGTVAFLILLRWVRLVGLVVLVAPMAFLGVFFSGMRLDGAETRAEVSSGAVPHLHVLLGSAGLSLLGLAGLAGVLYLIEHRRLKSKRRIDGRLSLPSLEALDRVNAAALGLGFPLLTLGVVTGGMWVNALHGRPWTGTVHETWTLLAWVVYAVLVALRFAVHQGARQCAASAIGGFALLAFAVLGVELIA